MTTGVVIILWTHSQCRENQIVVKDTSNMNHGSLYGSARDKNDEALSEFEREKDSDMTAF